MTEFQPQEVMEEEKKGKYSDLMDEVDQKIFNDKPIKSLACHGGVTKVYHNDDNYKVFSDNGILTSIFDPRPKTDPERMKEEEEDLHDFIVAGEGSDQTRVLKALYGDGFEGKMEKAKKIYLQEGEESTKGDELEEDFMKGYFNNTDEESNPGNESDYDSDIFEKNFNDTDDEEDIFS